MSLLKIEVCVGSACYLLGAQDLIELIERLPEKTKANIDLVGASCLKCCGKGPNVRVDGELLSGITPEILMEIISNKLSR